MCMVGMGFELEDCQAAVENGKLSVDEAVEWSVLCNADDYELIYSVAYLVLY